MDAELRQDTHQKPQPLRGRKNRHLSQRDTLESSTLDSRNHRLKDVISPALIEVTSANADIAINSP